MESFITKINSSTQYYTYTTVENQIMIKEEAASSNNTCELKIPSQYLLQKTPSSHWNGTTLSKIENNTEKRKAKEPEKSSLRHLRINTGRVH